MLLGDELIDKHVVFYRFWRLWWEIEADRFNLACLVPTIEEMDLNLFPACDFVVVFGHIITEFDTVEVTFLYILLIDIHKVNLNRQTSPLAVLKDFQHVLNIVNYTGGQYNRLIKDLGEIGYILPLKISLFLLVSGMTRQAFKKLQNRLYLDR